MKYHIISDSCCDLTEGTQNGSDVSIVPLSITMDEKLYIDDSTLEIPAFLADMKKAQKMTSGAPSPGAYLEKLQQDSMNFIVTLSSRLSGSYSSAATAQRLAQEEDAQVHVFDSLSASAGQMLVVRKLTEFVQKGMEKPQIVLETEAFIQNLRTFYIAQDLSNLVKNGRLGKVTGKLLSVLGIRPILAANDNGELVLKTHARGDKQTVHTIMDFISKVTKPQEKELVITHCNNSALAETLRQTIEQAVPFREIVVAHTRGLSSMYANDKGVVLSF